MGLYGNLTGWLNRENELAETIFFLGELLSGCAGV